MTYQRRIMTIATVIPFGLGLLHLALQIGGTSIDDRVMLPAATLKEEQLSPLFTVSNSQHKELHKSTNSVLLDTKNPLLNDVETDWAGFDVQSDTGNEDDHLNLRLDGAAQKRDDDVNNFAKELVESAKPKLFDVPKDRIRKDVGEPDSQETDHKDDRAADLGLTNKTYTTLRDLLKETANIDLGTKRQNVTESTNGEKLTEGAVEREERAFDCPESPPGVPEQCIPCADDQERTDSFQYTDSNGNTCQCEICMKPTYMKEPCTCTPDGQVAPGGDPTCAFPEQGKTFMNSQNWCPTPFPCSTCPDGLVIVKECQVDEDITCGCPENTDQTGETICTPIPLCQENYESVLDNKPGALYSSHVCKPCQDGYIQPHNDSWDKCYPRPNPKPENDNDNDDGGEPTENLPTTTEGTASSSRRDFSTIVPQDSSTKENKCVYECPKCEKESTMVPDHDTTMETPSTVVQTAKRYLGSISHTLVWVFTVLAALMIGIGIGIIFSPYVMTKYRQWCDKFAGRRGQADLNAHYNCEFQAVAIENEEQESPHSSRGRGQRRGGNGYVGSSRHHGAVRGRGKHGRPPTDV